MLERRSLASKISKVVHSRSLKLGIGSQGRLGRDCLLDQALWHFGSMRNCGVAFVTVISAFLELGSLDDACQLFAQMPNSNAVAWNVMISGHAKRGYEWEAIKLFQNMRNATVHTQATKQGFDSNVYVGHSLINMYAKCQKMEDAKRVFGLFDEKNVVLWNAMLGGYLQNGYASEVMELFFSTRVLGFHPDEFTYTSILSACGCLENLGMGQQLHSYIIKNKLEDNLFVGNALVDMYAKSGALDYARRKFELLENRDNVSWNVIIVGYVQDEKEYEAFKLFERMTSDGITPDEVSLASILSACANLRVLDRGKQVHYLSVKYGLETSLYTGSSLIDMYAKCGAIATVYEVFISMLERSVISANALIDGYAQHNLEKAVYLLHDMLAEEDALRTFDKMKEAHVKPDAMTFLGVLTACSHAGRVFEGCQVYDIMINHYHIEPRPEHCACMIDLLRRWGFIDEAQEFIHELEFEPDAMMWATFFVACRLHGDDIRGQHAAKKLIELEPEKSSPYVLLSHIHAASRN
ncbi:hypothetical protein RHSIM_Rhsim10G0083400 [Rhododendron simsii]|uniref:Pentatricopeptide repeat-containing protein n=1 Tax=Rhododendron simsii TaxID=118357 RepID=A0A834LCX2_RHOSS|nr:hypothetical protein RHSIM_Rhsim10G0083400 [Rhododendron simsii]